MRLKEKDIAGLKFGDRQNRTNAVIITGLIDVSIVEDSRNIHNVYATQKLSYIPY